MEILDEIDRKILFELDQNSRQSYVEIARRTRLLPETVKYRVEGLTQRKIIRCFFAKVDNGRLGFVHLRLFLRLQAVGDEHLDEIVAFLKRNQLCLRLTLFDGEWDIGCVFKVSKLEKIDAIVMELKSRFGQFIAGSSFALIVWGQYLARTYLVGKPRKGPYKSRYTGSSDYYALDRNDKFILKQLTDNSRVSASAISRLMRNSDKLLPLSIETVSQRIKRFERDKIVTGYGISINQEKCGRIGFKVLLYLNSLPADQLDTFVSFCQGHPGIFHIVRTLGEWDLDMDLDVADFRDCREILMELSRKFPKTIRHYVPLRFLSVEKLSFFTTSAA